MGTTLENGVYLPSEGERNCYAGLKTNWEILDQKVADVTALQQAVAGALHREIVESLPTTDIDPNTIYMILSGTSATENVYNEYMYVNNAWELIGTSATDLTNYYTKAEVDGKLLLKANDSDVVHKSGNETISGDKVFNNRLIKNIDVALGTAPSTTKFGTIEIADNNKSTLLQVMGGVYSNGQSYARFAIQNKMADDGTGLSPTGTLRGCGFNISLPATSTSEGIGSITPRANKTTDFGLSSYQWRNVWCEKLYLNGTQLDPSAFVTTDTNQTVSGGKTFSSPTRIYNSNATVQADVPSLVFKNSLVERASTTLEGEQTILFTDKNDNNIASIQAKTYTSGISDIILTSYSEYDGVKTTGIMIRRTPTTSKLQGYSDNITDLGDTNRRWRRVYAMSYYYGSDNVEFSTKFVTTDTNQTISGDKVWTGTNIFQQNVTYQRSNFYHQVVNPTYILKDTELEKGSLATTHHASYPGLWQDKNSNILGYVRFVEYSSGRQTAEIRVSNFIKNGTLDPTGSEVNCAVNLELQPSGEKSLIPELNNDINLGTSTNKWKTFNGVEPSSLSLPSGNASDVIDISSYITALDGTDNTYIAPANGWITITVGNCTIISCIITGYWSDNRIRTTSGNLRMMFPILKNQVVKIQIIGGTIDHARFIPCQGNV